MTSNQIAYVKQQEELRHNVAMESETYRANTAREQEQRRANDLSYAASIYSSQASMYNARLNYDANIYATQMQAATQRTANQLNYEVNRQRLVQEDFNADETRAETTRHNRAMEQAELSKAGSSRITSAGGFLNNVAGAVRTGLAIAGLMA